MPRAISALAVIERFIVSQVKSELAAADLGSVPVEPAKSDNALPVVTFALVAPRANGVTAQGDILFVSALYQVIFWQKGSTLGAADVLSAADAIETALHQKAGTNIDGLIYQSRLERPERVPPHEVEGQSVVGLGGVFDISARRP